MERGICQVPKSIRKNACMLQKGFEGKFNRIRHGPKAGFNFTLEGALLPGAGLKPTSSLGYYPKVLIS